MSVGRREFIIGSLGVAATANLLQGCGSDDASGGAAPPVDSALFAHGVSSGDPLGNAVILWTRVSNQTGPVAVTWTLCSDAVLKKVLQTGTVMATADADFTVQVDVQHLQPGTTYYYAFNVGSSYSVVGRTRTLPSSIDHARIAFTSCANWQNGYFSAYRAIAQRNDLDVWLHVGDYIYEYKPGVYADANLAPQRSHLPPNEAVTLQDYRGRYAQYRTDPDLQEIHRQHPLIIIWDDHEFANNAYVGGAENHDPATQGDWTTRKKAAQQAFREWLPIRVVQADPIVKIFRSFQFGDLFDLIMLDTRMYARDKQTGNDSTFGDTGDPNEWADPNRHIIGSEQENWLFGQLMQSQTRGAHWRLIGNQVVFTQGKDPLPMTGAPPLPAGKVDNMTEHPIIFSDFWDGYQADRNGVIDFALNNGIKNMVIMTGDIHSSWAFEISRDPFDPAVYNPAMGLPGFAVELVGPAVTSLALEDQGSLATLAPTLLAQNNPHLQFSEFTRKGYVLLDITAERIQAEWWWVKQFKAPNDHTEELGKAFTLQSNSARLIATKDITPPKSAPPMVT